MFDASLSGTCACSANMTCLQAPFKSEAPLLLDVLHSIFSGIEPDELLAAIDPPRAKHPRHRGAAAAPTRQLDMAGAKAILRREQRQVAAMQSAVPRHSRFGSTFVQRSGGDARPKVLSKNHMAPAVAAVVAPGKRTVGASSKVCGLRPGHECLAGAGTACRAI